MRGCLTALLLLLCGCGASPAPSPTPAPERGAEAAPAQCASIPADGAFSRGIEGADRACTSDSDCSSVELDCSHLRCGAASRPQSYQAPINCTGYSGDMG